MIKRNWLMIAWFVFIVAVWVCVVAAETQGQEAAARGWSIHRTQNFTVHHRRNPRVAEEIGVLSERIRTAIAAKWFPREPDPDWVPRCDVLLYPSANEYSFETGVSKQSPAHTNILNDGGKILSRKLLLRLDYPAITQWVLPHEITHLVLCGRFGKHALPRWADEGIAVLSEPRASQEGHLKNLFYRQRFSAFEIITATDYPNGQAKEFYAHSVAICNFLERRGGPAKLVEFLRLSLESWEYATPLRQAYALEIEDLDAAFALDSATIYSQNYCDWTCQAGTCPIEPWRPVVAAPAAPATPPPLAEPPIPTIDLDELSRLVAQRLPTPSQGPPGERGPLGLSITGPQGEQGLPGSAASIKIAIEGKDGEIVGWISPDEDGIVRLPPIRVFLAGKQKTVPLGGDLSLDEGPREE